ncbi:hypothetical protein MJN47_31670, partial [Salmonella enterica subsp. enterica serovar Lubbock]|nr:hypothetical protein [Salmonella enterica subsp. enterica serovar Lubbock]
LTAEQNQILDAQLRTQRELLNSLLQGGDTLILELTKLKVSNSLQLGEPGYRGNLRELLADSRIQRAFLLLDDTLELCYDVAKLS